MRTYAQMNEMTNDEINKAMLAEDESHKWPIRNKFNATERAIKNVAQFAKEGCYNLQGMEYELALDAEITRIVNNEANWA